MASFHSWKRLSNDSLNQRHHDSSISSIYEAKGNHSISLFPRLLYSASAHPSFARKRARIAKDGGNRGGGGREEKSMDDDLSHIEKVYERIGSIDRRIYLSYVQKYNEKAIVSMYRNQTPPLFFIPCIEGNRFAVHQQAATTRILPLPRIHSGDDNSSIIHSIITPSNDCGLPGMLFHLCTELAIIQSNLQSELSVLSASSSSSSSTITDIPPSIRWLRPTSNAFSRMPVMPSTGMKSFTDKQLKAIRIVSIDDYQSLIDELVAITRTDDTFIPPQFIIIENVFQMITADTHAEKADRLFEFGTTLSSVLRHLNSIYGHHSLCTAYCVFDGLSDSFSSILSPHYQPQDKTSSVGSLLREYIDQSTIDAANVSRRSSASSSSSVYAAMQASMNNDAIFANFILHYSNELIHIQPDSSQNIGFYRLSSHRLQSPVTIQLSNTTPVDPFMVYRYIEGQSIEIVNSS